MTFTQIWDQLMKKDSRLIDPDTKVEFTSGNLKKLLRQVYDQGRDSAPKPSSSSTKRPEDQLGDMFGGIFGR